MSTELEGSPFVLLRWKMYDGMGHETFQNPDICQGVLVSTILLQTSRGGHLAPRDMGSPLLTWPMQHCAPPILLVDGYCKRMGPAHEANMSEPQDSQSA